MATAAAPVNYAQFVRKLTIPRPLSFILCTALLASIFFVAIRIRLFAVITYGRIIHEFDPWFNYRATEYMVEHGYAKFEAWYDDKVWYPLGRHVGSTTYPGLQLTAYALHELLKHVHPMSVNDVCVLMPAAFGGIASLLCGALAYEVTFSRAAAISAAALMAVLPAPVIQADAEIQTPDPSRSRNPHP
jgi:dolichyl-diphosphooligosaccharide--protein glycosyltransferase